MQPPQGFPEHFNFILRRSFLALGLLQGTKDLLNFVKHAPQFCPDMEHLLDGFANARGRFLSLLPGVRWVLAALVPFATVLPLLSASALVAVSATAPPSEARTTSAALTARLLGFARGSGLGFGGFYRISGWFLCIHLYLPANFCLSRPKINGNKRILC
jgi:hypothetical protein